MIGNVRQDFIAKTFKKTETDEQQIIEFLFDNANSPITTNSIEDKTGVPKRQHARIFEQLQTKIERYNGLQSSVRLVLIRKRNRDKLSAKKKDMFKNYSLELASSLSEITGTNEKKIYAELITIAEKMFETGALEEKNGE